MKRDRPGRSARNPRGRGRMSRRASEGNVRPGFGVPSGLVRLEGFVAGPWLCFSTPLFAIDISAHPRQIRLTHRTPNAILTPASGGCRLNREAPGKEPYDCIPGRDSRRTHKAATSCARHPISHFTCLGCHVSNPSKSGRSVTSTSTLTIKIYKGYRKKSREKFRKTLIFSIQNRYHYVIVRHTGVYENAVYDA